MAKICRLGFILSKSQPSTPGDGNCLFHAISDHLPAYDYQSLRRLVISSVLKQCEERRIFWMYDGGEDPYQWMGRMKKPGVYGDEVCLQVLRLINITITIS